MKKEYKQSEYFRTKNEIIDLYIKQNATEKMKELIIHYQECMKRTNSFGELAEYNKLIEKMEIAITDGE